MDVVDTNTRSRMMANIQGKNTRPEMLLRKALHAKGLRYRLHAGKLKGKPDILMPGRRIAIFVHGCFWHRHQGCFWCSTPASNIEFWEAKFLSNVRRDAAAVQALIDDHWRVATVWECGVRKPYIQETLEDLVGWIGASAPLFESKVVRPRSKQSPVSLDSG